MKSITIKQIEHHRNGIGGLPFHAVLFEWKDGAWPGVRTMIASVFEEPGAVAVYDVALLSSVGVGFGYNSWRGDGFEPALRAAIAKKGGVPE